LRALRGASINEEALWEERLVQAYMNEAQQNVVALSVFLASALCRGGRLRTVVLDDPVQAMDEVNIYGLLDLLRQVSTQAQVIMTTGRNDLFHLARAKFACLNAGNARRFGAYRLKWGGPEVGTLVEEVTWSGGRIRARLVA
jgi:ABC-type cobalamin/Fe3+-siderophores transport system ATPase subunit